MTVPVVYDLMVDYARFGLSYGQAANLLTHCFDNRAGAEPRYIGYHIQDGETRGSLEYWLGVQASSTVMIQRDGSILQVIPEQHGPWTNGDVMNPTAQAKPILDLGGNPNIWGLTIEMEGHPFDPVTQAQIDSAVWQSQTWMRRYPKITAPVWTIPHRSINSITRANCPGPAGNSYYEAVMKRLAGGTTTPYVSADIPAEAIKLLLAGKDAMLGKEVVYACRRRWTVARDTPRRQYADLASKPVGPPLKKGETFEGLGVFDNSDGIWTITQFGTRIFLGDCTPEFPFFEAA